MTITTDTGNPEEEPAPRLRHAITITIDAAELGGDDELYDTLGRIADALYRGELDDTSGRLSGEYIIAIERRDSYVPREQYRDALMAWFDRVRAARRDRAAADAEA